MRRLFALLLVVLVLHLSGCGSESPTAESGMPSAGAPGPELQVEVVHTYFNDDPLGRFTFKFTNPADETRVGAKATWKALDEDGAIVGTHDTALPPIDPGGTWYYVGGAGGANLSGVPAQVKVEVTDDGELRSDVPPSLVSVEKSDFTRADFDMNEGAKSYDVTAVLASSGDVKTADIRSAILLFDGEGQIVGGEQLDLWSAPERLGSSEKLNTKTSVDVAGGEPVKVEVYAWAE